jgi:sentrin-specific protease 1
MDLKEIRYYDSFNGTGQQYTAAIMRWLKDEANEWKQINDYDMTEWRCVSMTEIPQQKNGFDCGMFVIMNCDFMSDDLPLTEDSFSQVDMPSFRLKTALRIFQGSLPYPLVCL